MSRQVNRGRDGHPSLLGLLLQFKWVGLVTSVVVTTLLEHKPFASRGTRPLVGLV